MLFLSQAQKSQGWINTEHSEAGAHSDYTCTYTDFSILAMFYIKRHALMIAMQMLGGLLVTPYAS